MFEPKQKQVTPPCNMGTSTKGTVFLPAGDIPSSMPQCVTFQCWGPFYVHKIMSSHRSYCQFTHKWRMEANWQWAHTWKWLQGETRSERAKKEKEKAEGEKTGCFCPPRGKNVQFPGFSYLIKFLEHLLEGWELYSFRICRSKVQYCIYC